MGTNKRNSDDFLKLFLTGFKNHSLKDVIKEEPSLLNTHATQMKSHLTNMLKLLDALIIIDLERATNDGYFALRNHLNDDNVKRIIQDINILATKVISRQGSLSKEDSDKLDNLKKIDFLMNIDMQMQTIFATSKENKYNQVKNLLNECHIEFFKALSKLAHQTNKHVQYKDFLN